MLNLVLLLYFQKENIYCLEMFFSLFLRKQNFCSMKEGCVISMFSHSGERSAACRNKGFVLMHIDRLLAQPWLEVAFLLSSVMCCVSLIWNGAENFSDV